MNAANLLYLTGVPGTACLLIPKKEDSTVHVYSVNYEQAKAEAKAPKVEMVKRGEDLMAKVAGQIKAFKIKKLAADIGLTRLWLVGNKVRDLDEAAFLQRETPGLPILGFLSADMAVQEADRLGIAVYDHVAALKTSAQNMALALAAQITE